MLRDHVCVMTFGQSMGLRGMPPQTHFWAGVGAHVQFHAAHWKTIPKKNQKTFYYGLFKYKDLIYHYF